MNESLNLEEKLKYCPKGTKLWDSKRGPMRYCYQSELLGGQKILVLADRLGSYYPYNSNGELANGTSLGEASLFPSKTTRDWNMMNWSKPKAKDVKIGDRIMCSDDKKQWFLDIYGGQCSKGIHMGAVITVTGIHPITKWEYMIPECNFDINNIKESLKHDINRFYNE